MLDMYYFFKEVDEVPSITDIDEDLYLPLFEALQSGNIVKIVYSDNYDNITIREVLVEVICFTKNTWYFVAFCHLADERRTFKIANVDSLKILERTEDSHGIAKYVKKYGLWGNDVYKELTTEVAQNILTMDSFDEIKALIVKGSNNSWCMKDNFIVNGNNSRNRFFYPELIEALHCFINNIDNHDKKYSFVFFDCCSCGVSCFENYYVESGVNQIAEKMQIINWLNYEDAEPDIINITILQWANFVEAAFIQMFTLLKIRKRTKAELEYHFGNGKYSELEPLEYWTVNTEHPFSLYEFVEIVTDFQHIRDEYPQFFQFSKINFVDKLKKKMAKKNLKVS